MVCKVVSLVLSFLAFQVASALAVVASDATVGQPQLARQILLPSFAKSDWQGTSFSTDGRLLLIVDEQRSFFLDVESGRELRPVTLDAGEQLIWARPRPNTAQWVAATNRARFVVVNSLDGSVSTIMDLAARFGYSSYRSKAITFEFLSNDEIVAFVKTPRERPNPDGGTIGWNDQALISLVVGTAALTGWRDVSSEEFFTNLDGLIVVNRSSNLIGVFDPKTSAPATIWQFDPDARDANRFRLSCSVTNFEPVVAALIPFKDGFAALRKDASVEHLRREAFGTSACGGRNASSDPSKDLKESCRWQIGGTPTVAAAQGRTDGEFILIRRSLELERVTLSTNGCALTVTALARIDGHYYPTQIARSLNATPDPSVIEAEEFLVHFIPRLQAYAVIAAGTLSRVPLGEKAPTLIATLLGKPTGVLDLEAAPGLLLGGRLLAPLRVFDTRFSTLRSIEHDYVTYYDKAWVYSKPYAIARGIGAVAVLAFDGGLTFHGATSSIDSGILPSPQQLKMGRPGGICVSDDATKLFVSTDESSLRLFQRKGASSPMTESAALALGKGVDLYKIACDAAGTLAIVADSLTNKVFVVEVRKAGLILKQTLTVDGSSRLLSRPSLSRDNLLLGIGPHLFARPNRDGNFARLPFSFAADKLAFSEDGKQLMAFGQRSALYALQRGPRGASVVFVRGDFGPASDGAFVDADNIVLARGNEELEFTSTANASVGRLVFGDGADWLFTDTSSRFDLNDIEKQTAGYWLMPDDPLRALPPEIFMRDYFEPGLLNRLLECRREQRVRADACSEFKGVRPLATLNRVQPYVEIVGIARDPDNADEVAVSVEVRGLEQTYGIVGHEQTRQSGAFDLRLFRGGQLVRQAPDRPVPESGLAQDSDAEMQRWRKEHLLVDKVGSRRIDFPRVRLPANPEAISIEFSAYAFNEDRVKSRTDIRRYVPKEVSAPKRRAYVVAIGVSASETADWDLQYADNDAHRFVESLLPRLKSSGRYDEVVPVMVTSSWSKDIKGVRHVENKDATKANIKAVFDALSGAATPDALPAALVQNTGLRRANPDDLVLILFSSHGYADDAGNFYLFPYDIGATEKKKVNADVLKRAVSSAELSLWLRDVDASELVMIVDACHSAASVEGSGFKPGPMGSRGLGQLAYDKGMRILASTRADDLAWESPNTKQGLLSYALIYNGVEQGRADYRPTDGRIGIGEWLRFAAERVPQLYLEDKRGFNSKLGAKFVAFDGASRKSRRVEADGKDVAGRTQRPALFDYRRGNDPVLVNK